MAAVAVSGTRPELLLLMGAAALASRRPPQAELDG